MMNCSLDRIITKNIIRYDFKSSIKTYKNQKTHYKIVNVLANILSSLEKNFEKVFNKENHNSKIQNKI